ncbi:hypothetical protein G7Y29_03980 [Corynebacterium qintianiae]|uniref:Secreted protein n=1 Tax=Corynebacterium qintianiae TaxID=2709392 RepID=A0A7T0PFJ9_9CORY|nr:hypothetical protein [Corynebacterium qintianiae]QPK83955.1 hypothetical protein G7Y29_03980 [Corynebacterium qintianiae]
MPAFTTAFPRRRCCAAATAAALLGLSTLTSETAAHAVDLSSQYVDELGRPTDLTVSKVHEFADQPFVPPRVADALRTAVGFFAGTGEIGGPPLPDTAPGFTQFIWPTVSSNCIGPGLHSTASAIAVPGPAKIPAPGAAAGQTVFLFTALGTPPAAQEQGLMNVYWVNVSNFRTGVTPLNNNQINTAGPATLSGTADTGSGQILAVVDGSVRTADNVCSFAPTATSFHVR